MTTLSSYLEEKRLLLASEYKGDCLAIARDIARLLLEEQRQPFIALLVRKEVRGELKFYGPLSPKKYLGRVTWTKHYVCCCDGQVYDPMLGEPAPLEEYSQKVFGLEIPLQTFIPTELISRYVNGRIQSQKVGP